MKEMYSVGMAFKVLDEGQKAPAGWHKVTGHLVWDVKMDFTSRQGGFWMDIKDPRPNRVDVCGGCV